MAFGLKQTVSQWASCVMGDRWLCGAGGQTAVLRHFEGVHWDSVGRWSRWPLYPRERWCVRTCVHLCACVYVCVCAEDLQFLLLCAEHRGSAVSCEDGAAACVCESVSSTLRGQHRPAAPCKDDASASMRHSPPCLFVVNEGGKRGGGSVTRHVPQGYGSPWQPHGAGRRKWIGTGCVHTWLTHGWQRHREFTAWRCHGDAVWQVLRGAKVTDSRLTWAEVDLRSAPLSWSPTTENANAVTFVSSFFKRRQVEWEDSSSGSRVRDGQGRGIWWIQGWAGEGPLVDPGWTHRGLQYIQGQGGKEERGVSCWIQGQFGQLGPRVGPVLGRGAPTADPGLEGGVFSRTRDLW